MLQSARAGAEGDNYQQFTNEPEGPWSFNAEAKHIYPFFTLQFIHVYTYQKAFIKHCGGQFSLIGFYAASSYYSELEVVLLGASNSLVL